ncbi:STAS domain-containing protein [Dactylosporangium aurantiacum]|uniref:Anti-sigma factor antagonist n=1 Tax=Dactylosporangium aurantiacum TaxID=35754 RepID=A0A9Q9ICM2_9ACTN|nr:STAS domain-containing protein [Dactylosporangium aurantiacum]MDG6103572.1 STAS domain-containing protein [Dactylosporangium aurantiacum]UWZ51935.1 STAS domain-containing protein [Dactylosporangium aurantiacum]
MEFSLAREGAAGHQSERVAVEATERDGAVVVTVTGRVLYDTLGPLAEQLSHLVAGPSPRVVLDLAQVPMCDSSGLNLFVRTRTELLAADGWLRLAATQPMVDNVLHITNLDRILPRYPTVEEATGAA